MCYNSNKTLFLLFYTKRSSCSVNALTSLKTSRIRLSKSEVNTKVSRVAMNPLHSL